MAIAIVQTSSLSHGGNIGDGSSFNVSLTGTATDNGLILMVPWYDSGGYYGVPQSISDGVNPWSVTADSAAYVNVTSANIYSIPNNVGGNITVTIGNGSGSGGSTSVYAYAVLLEVSGMPTSGINDYAANGGNSHNSTGPVTATATVAPLASNELAVTCFALNNNTDTGLSNPPAGFTSIFYSLTGFPSYGFAYKLNAGSSVLSPSYGTLGAVGYWAAVSALYKAGSVTPLPNRLRKKRIYVPISIPKGG